MAMGATAKRWPSRTVCARARGPDESARTVPTSRRRVAMATLVCLMAASAVFAQRIWTGGGRFYREPPKWVKASDWIAPQKDVVRPMLEAAAATARQLGITPLILGDAIEGEARDVGKVHAGIALHAAERAQPTSCRMAFFTIRPRKSASAMAIPPTRRR